jgi:hypothetical protein
VRIAQTRIPEYLAQTRNLSGATSARLRQAAQRLQQIRPLLFWQFVGVFVQRLGQSLNLAIESRALPHEIFALKVQQQRLRVAYFNRHVGL